MLADCRYYDVTPHRTNVEGNRGEATGTYAVVQPKVLSKWSCSQATGLWLRSSRLCCATAALIAHTSGMRLRSGA